MFLSNSCLPVSIKCLLLCFFVKIIELHLLASVIFLNSLPLIAQTSVFVPIRWYGYNSAKFALKMV